MRYSNTHNRDELSEGTLRSEDPDKIRARYKIFTKPNTSQNTKSLQVLHARLCQPYGVGEGQRFSAKHLSFCAGHRVRHILKAK